MSVDNSIRPVVLITGAAGGLGGALVQAFADSGWQVVAACRTNPFSSPSPSIWPVAMDVTKPDEIKSVCAEVARRWNRIDVLINNAGVADDEVLPRLSEAAWQRVMDVNLSGAFLCSRAVLPGMIHRRDGHILNIASFGGRVGRAGQSNYAASKAGLVGLTVALAREHGADNIRVNAILPGFLPTRLAGDLTESQLAAHAASNTLNRLNSPGEVARFATVLAAMKNVSGQMFQLDSRIGSWS